MNKKMTSLILAAALMAPGMSCWADDTNATGNNNSPLAHPINAYSNHEVKEDIKDSQEHSQKAAQAEADYKQAKTEYEDSLKANGADSQTTKDAKSRMKKAHHAMNKHNKKTAEANTELRKHEAQAQNQ